MRHRVLASALLALVVAACGGDGKITEPQALSQLKALAAIGTDPNTGATIETNKDDYVPGEKVHVTGRSWAPNETVTLFMTEDPNTHDDISMDVQADSVGAFSVHFYDVQSHDVGVVFTLTATGGTSRSVATAMFTDGTIDALTATIQTRDAATCTAPQGTVVAGLPICAFASFSISGSGVTPAQLRWRNAAGTVVAISQRSPSFPAGTIGAQTFNATYTPTTTGTWTVLLCESNNPDPAAGGGGCQPAGAQKAVQTFEVTSAAIATTTSVAASPTPSVFGQPVTFTATVTPVSGPVATGTVHFYEFTGTQTCSALGAAVALGSDASAPFEYPTSALAVGSHTISACYVPNAGWTASGNSTTHDVGKADVTVTVSDAPPSSNVGQNVTFTATVAAAAPGAGTPAGTVTFYEFTGTQTCLDLGAAVALGSDATAPFEYATSSLSAGNHTINACYGGDGNFNPGSGSDTHSVSLIATTVEISSSQDPSVTGEQVTFTATVKAGGSPIGANGSVTFRLGGGDCTTGTQIGAVKPLNGSGQATSDATSFLASGSPYTIRACYGGNATYEASNNTYVQDVNKAQSTLSLGTSGSPSYFGDNVTFTATIGVQAPGAGFPSGTVRFYDGGTCNADGTGTGTLLGSDVIASGAADLTTAALNAGTHTINACYGGDDDFLGANDDVSQVVNKATTNLALGSDNNPSEFGENVTFTATITFINGSGTLAGGTVNFSDDGTCQANGTISGGTSLGSDVISGNTADVTANSLAAGPHSIVACYGGTANIEGDGDVLTQNVDKKPTSTTVTVETATPQYSDEVKLKAVVTPHIVLSSELTGTVNFYVNGSVSCASPPATPTASDAITAADDGVAEAEYQITTAAGSYTVTACFVSSNPNFANSSNTTAMTVDKENASIAPDAGNLNAFAVGSPGGTATFTLKFSVREINPEPDVNAGALPGDIDNAGVTTTLKGVGTNATTSVACTSPVIATPPAYADVKVFTCNFVGVPVDAYEVEAAVTGNHYQAAPYADALTVYDPAAGFVTGGGKFVYPDASYDRVSFGLVFNFTGKGKTTPRGNLVVVRHMANGDVCRLKSNAIDAPAVVGITASFSGKGNYGCSRPDGTTYDGIGNQTILGWVQDNGEGSNATEPDKIWINMNVPNSKLLMSAPAADNARPLTGGNIQVPQPSSNR